MNCFNMFKYSRDVFCCFPKNYYGTAAKEIFDSHLLDVDYKNTTKFVPPIEYGKVIKVYDGDTITIASTLPNSTLPIYRFSVRLRGIDSAEIKGSTETEKKLAIVARDALHGLINGKIVTLKNVDVEKYGRVLADVYLENLHVNQWLLNNNYAVPYDGGKKIRSEEWDA
jgi:micrococcal nuclease